MYWLDWTLLILFSLAALHGVRRGFFAQIMHLLGTLVGLWVAVRTASFTVEWLSGLCDISTTQVFFLAVGLNLVVVLVLLFLLQRVWHSAKKVVLPLAWLDATAGALFSFFSALLLASSFLLVFDHVGLLRASSPVAKGVIVKRVRPVAAKVYPTFQEFLPQGMHWLREEGQHFKESVVR